MVQLTTSAVVAALLIAPTLAAPFANEAQEFSAREETSDNLAARDPRIGRILKKVGHVISGAATVGGAAAALAPATQARDLEMIQELAARDPRLGRILKKVGHVISGAATVGGAAAALAPATQARDLEMIQELAARDPRLGRILKKVGHVISGAATVGGAAAALAPPSQRDLEYLEDLSAREPIFGKVLKVAKKVVGTAAKIALRRDLEELEFTAREVDLLEELAVREPSIFNKIGKVAKQVAHVGGHIASETVKGMISRRELEEMEFTTRELEIMDELAAREPGFGKIFNVAKKVVGTAAKVILRRDLEANGLSARELEIMDELAARGLLGRVVRVAKGVTAGATTAIGHMLLRKRDLELLEELAARDPSVFGKIFNVAKKVAGTAAKVILRRELEEVEELAAREYYDELD